MTNDPGIPQIAFLSPVTGRIVLPDEVERERKEGRMPELERAPDLLGRSSIFADLVDTRRLVLAIDLPGPVLTAPNVPPRPLCRLMIFGATPDELIFRDAEKLDAPPVRLPRSSLARMDVVNDDQQISFLLGDGRQIHLDLRTLSRTHASTVRALVRRLRELVDSGR